MRTTDHLDLLTKLLASENLQIVEGDFATASMDVVDRVLRVPCHEHSSYELRVLFRAHEVGHALFTPADCFHEAMEDSDKWPRHLFPYINIVEDIRIEKMIQTKFPGLKQDFSIGYRELWLRGFFEGFHPETSNIADRANVHFKVGELGGVKFKKSDIGIMKLLDSCITFDEVVHAAKVLYEMAKQEMKEKDKESESEGQGGQGSDGEGDASGSGGFSEALKSLKRSGGQSIPSDIHIPEPKTFEQKEGACEELASNANVIQFSKKMPNIEKIDLEQFTSLWD